jgi:A/G-specific adenine glycosylase
MLQQTTVAVVLPYYERFLKAFPALASLAQASEEEVLARWSGLGYYRRAKLLHQGAKLLQEKFRGQLPRQTENLQKIPGIGPYTAGAIASIAFGEAAPLVDGNVVRVLSRLFGLKGHAKSGELRKKVGERAARLLDARHPGDFNQALMELGATVCRPVLPSCERCPVDRFCSAQKTGRAETYPEPAPQKKTVPLYRAAALCRQNGGILLVKKQNSRWFQGMWELPQDFREAPVLSPDSLGALLRRQLGVSVANWKPLPQTRHSITHHRITTQAWLGDVRGNPRPKHGLIAAHFNNLTRIEDYSLSNLDRKVLVAANLIAAE